MSAHVKLTLARESALQREKNACRACGVGGHLNRHEEPPRSHGNWTRFVERNGIIEIRRRLVMLCDDCHGDRHPVPYATIKLYIEILDPARGTDGVLRFIRENLMTGQRDIWEMPARYLFEL